MAAGIRRGAVSRRDGPRNQPLWGLARGLGWFEGQKRRRPLADKIVIFGQKRENPEWQGTIGADIMKAVILAGGLGSRLAEETVVRPKPMVEIGGKPILWHIMNIFSCHGIDEFIIALGYRGEVVKEYFLNFYALNNDLTLDLATGGNTHSRRPAAALESPPRRHRPAHANRRPRQAHREVARRRRDAS